MRRRPEVVCTLGNLSSLGFLPSVSRFSTAWKRVLILCECWWNKKDSYTESNLRRLRPGGAISGVRTEKDEWLRKHRESCPWIQSHVCVSLWCCPLSSLTLLGGGIYMVTLICRLSTPINSEEDFNLLWFLDCFNCILIMWSFIWLHFSW